MVGQIYEKPCLPVVTKSITMVHISKDYTRVDIHEDPNSMDILISSTLLVLSLRNRTGPMCGNEKLCGHQAKVQEELHLLRPKESYT